MTHKDISRSMGFTLVEVLVVISIVSLLLSLLLPSLDSARETARRITCSSQIRQVTSTATIYTIDYKGVLPGHNAYLLDDWTTQMGMAGLSVIFDGTSTAGYVGGQYKLNLCPSKSNPVRWIGTVPSAANTFWTNKTWTTGQGAYAFPAGSSQLKHNVGASPNQLELYWVQLEKHVMDMPMICDAVAAETGPTPAFPWLQQSNHFGNDNSTSGGNSSFADGHCQWIPWNQAYNQYSRRWSNYNVVGSLYWPTIAGTTNSVTNPAAIDYYGSYSNSLYYFPTLSVGNPSRGILVPYP